jgi:hypothetical protein
VTDTDAVNLSTLGTSVSAFPSGTTVSCSIFIKQGTSSTNTLECGAIGDVGTASSITWTAGVPSASIGTITSAGNGWYRLSMQITTVATGSFLFRFWPVDKGQPNSATGSVYLWGAQLEVSPSVTGYKTTTSASGGAWKLLFPPSPNDGDPVEIMDIKSSFATNNCSLIGNGKTIMGYTTLVCNTKNMHLVFTYDALSGDWRI